PAPGALMPARHQCRLDLRRWRWPQSCPAVPGRPWPTGAPMPLGIGVASLMEVHAAACLGRFDCGALAIDVMRDPPLLPQTDDAVHRVIQAQAGGEEGKHDSEQQ